MARRRAAWRPNEAAPYGPAAVVPGLPTRATCEQPAALISFSLSNKNKASEGAIRVGTFVHVVLMFCAIVSAKMCSYSSLYVMHACTRIYPFTFVWHESSPRGRPARGARESHARSLHDINYTPGNRHTGEPAHGDPGRRAHAFFFSSWAPLPTGYASGCLGPLPESARTLGRRIPSRSSRPTSLKRFCGARTRGVAGRSDEGPRGACTCARRFELRGAAR